MKKSLSYIVGIGFYLVFFVQIGAITWCNNHPYAWQYDVPKKTYFDCLINQIFSGTVITIIGLIVITISGFLIMTNAKPKKIFISYLSVYIIYFIYAFVMLNYYIK